MKQSVEQRIEPVVSNLLPQTAFRGQWGPPASLHERLARHHTPGVSIAVINNFEIDWARGFGTCETGSPDEVTPTTLFQAASISKPVFAMAVNYLAQEGRIELDEYINVYLRSRRVPANEGWQPRITGT